MPLTNLQSSILRLIARNRNPESFVAGSAWLARTGPRYSSDIDIFHDRELRAGEAADRDSEALRAAGYHVAFSGRSPMFIQALVSSGGETTKPEWVVDSEFRFFPVVQDEVFGYILHPVDLATNKVMAVAGRREPRDVVDLLAFHGQTLPLGALIWAAVEKAPGFTPEALINEIRRLATYRQDDFDRVACDSPYDAATVARAIRAALFEAEAFVEQMPTDKAGLLFLENGKPVQPDPARLADYETHAGSRRGLWPSSSEIGSAMLESYGKIGL